MLIKKMTEEIKNLDNGNIEEIASLEEVFNSKSNTFVKEVLKRYNTQHKSMEVRLFIQDKIELYNKERNRQLCAENEQQTLTYKINADLLLKNIIKFMKFAQREHINMQTTTNELIFVQDGFYIKHCANLGIEPTEIMPKNLYKDLLTLCDGNHASNVIYLYPFFRDTACIDKYVEYIESQPKDQVIPEWEIDILLSIKKSIEEDKNKNYLEEENCLSGQDLHYFYVKMRESIFNNLNNQDLIKILKNPELSFIITEGDTRAKIEKLINDENFELVYEIIKHYDSGCGVDKKFLKKLDEYQISTIMQHSINDSDADASTGLFVSSKIAQNHQKDYFAMLKKLKDYKNMFRMLNDINKINTYTNGYLKNKTEKYEKMLKEFYTYINENTDEIKEYVALNFTREQFNDYYDMIEFLFSARTEDSNFDNFTEITNSFGIDFAHMQEED